LTRSQYVKYKCIVVETVIASLGLFILALSAQYARVFGFSPSEFAGLGLVTATLGVFAGLKVAHRGKQKSVESIDKISEPAESIIRGASTGMRFFGLVGGVVFLTLCTVIIVVNLLIGKPTPPAIVLMAIVIALVLYWKFKETKQ
jgi:hypothetical protein